MIKIPISAIKHTYYTLIDDEDYELIEPYHWYYWAETRNGRQHGPYACAKAPQRGKDKQRTIRMHKLITGWEQTDHVDGDGLNNQRYNLRPATDSQNRWNQRSGVGSSIFKGVSWTERDRRWRAYITVNRKRTELGWYTDEVDAACAYDVAAAACFGEYSRLNFPESRCV